MSSAHCPLTEDQFLCSICLDVFTDPVSTPCAHNFCNDCITEHWTVSDTCPMREELFYTRPQLRVNTFISEMVAQFRHEARQKTSSSSSSEQRACDACTGTKLRALKSCLVSLASYCETHLGPHLRAPRLKRHRLIDPVDSLEDRVCMRHEKNPWSRSVRQTRTCVCTLCPVSGHETHDVVPLREECERKKVELEATEAGSQQMLQKRRLRIQEVKRSVKISEDEAEGVQVIAALKESVDRGLNELIKEIEDKQATTENPAEDSITELERQISELTTRGTEVEQLSLSEDHLLFLRSLPSPQAAPPTKDWTQVRVRPPSHEGTVVRAASELEETLSREDLGVASESIERKGKLHLSPEFGYWAIWLRNGNEYAALCGPGVRLSLRSQPEGVGVFVDYEQGLVSLRDADAAAHTYSYTCRCFTEKLHPYFCPSNNEGGENSAPLIICPNRFNFGVDRDRGADPGISFV
uniref:Uncharacterized protein n=1 Tax=Scophthalmus maximus TaxID=52904 RepID=A0A8D2ZHU2_SCOMX